MKKVTKYQSEDGSLHDSEIEALRADNAYYAERDKKLREIEAAQKASDRYEPGYHLDRGGHM